jgi:hypothetical protein
MAEENKLAQGAGGEAKKVVNATIETYAYDLAKVVVGNENGLVKMIIDEEEKQKEEKEKKSPERQKNQLFLYAGIFLIVASFIAVSLVFFFRQKIFQVEVPLQYVPIIFTDKTEFKEIAGLKKEEIIQTVLNEVNTAEFKDGGIEGVFLTADKKVVGLRAFLTLIEANLNQTKLEFVSDGFLIGAVNKESKIPFILIKTRYIADIFDAMRAWENKMFLDLHKFSGIDINKETKYLLESNFEDGIIQNKNARILKDKDGKIVMIYVFADENSVIITNSELAVKEIMLRLVSSKIKK